jgi:hypothetical protein
MYAQCQLRELPANRSVFQVKYLNSCGLSNYWMLPDDRIVCTACLRIVFPHCKNPCFAVCCFTSCLGTNGRHFEYFQ